MKEIKISADFEDISEFLYIDNLRQLVWAYLKIVKIFRFFQISYFQEILTYLKNLRCATSQMEVRAAGQALQPKYSGGESGGRHSS